MEYEIGCGEELNRFVLFADILGFADLVAEDDIARRNFRPANSNDGPSGSALVNCFLNFHRMLENWLDPGFGKTKPLTSVLFSDSIFAVYEDLPPALAFAKLLACSLIDGEVPVRIGIGYGSFHAMRFATDAGARISHRSQFFGTGVTNACRAESCGVPGMRVLLHPSVDSWLATAAYGPIDGADLRREIIPLEVPAPRYGIVNELNYLPDPRLHTDEAMGHARWVSRRHESSPTQEKRHYAQTLHALRRMWLARTLASGEALPLPAELQTL